MSTTTSSWYLSIPPQMQPYDASRASMPCRLACGGMAFAHSWSFTTAVSKYAMPTRMCRHGMHIFLGLYRHRLPVSRTEQSCSGSRRFAGLHAVLKPALKASSTSGMPQLESCAGEKFPIIHHPFLPYVLFIRSVASWFGLANIGVA
ncbi:hypothetical protein CABS03_01317 [Colletotrichum abscissum]|uniref:Uncharacterized protein n=1 Tax=Colletotrichum abscissum TaxID=1671311 RepID=A0A9P9X5C0_9PEZI|nr:hypothetical protein CABS02_12290 [Colletotrichum abscissum]